MREDKRELYKTMLNISKKVEIMYKTLQKKTKDKEVL